MIKNLLIVESPAKAKTIEKYLGKDFTVEASYGHIRDLPKDDFAVDIANGYEPTYIIPEDKTNIVRKLQDLAKKASAVWLATDEDREGEAISWHLAKALNLEISTTKRIVFHEITASAIKKAIESPRVIDMNLVEAQQARRILDRLVGFEISPVLWKKVKFGLSAGRVQSVAVRLIAEREREIHAFNPVVSFKTVAELKPQTGNPFKAELSTRFPESEVANAFLRQCIGATFKVAKLETKPGKRSPSAPFTTSTLQQEASSKLSFSVSKTMRLAQSLYENGHISYMRTDSVTLSDDALNAAGQAILSQFGTNYYQRRTFKNKVANAQEAHEAIRPTDFTATRVSADNDEQRLYELIWKRTVASQMADAQLERTVVDIEILPASPPSSPLPKLVATGEIIVFDGFLKLYLDTKEDDDDDKAEQGLLPKMKVGDVLTLLKMTATERFSNHPPRYTEASLVKKLEELGIGRPSTYAPTISTIQNRNYVVKESREGVERLFRVHTLQDNTIKSETKKEITGTEKNKLFPTDLGTLVTDFLVQNFEDIVDYSFTARMEEDFDKISLGKMERLGLLDSFYPPFHAKVQDTGTKAERVHGERILGIDPQTGKPVIARLGRYGPLVQLGGQDDEDKRFASLQPNQRLETLSLTEALSLFNLPRLVGEYEDLPIKANNGRFGPYLLHDNKFYSIPKGMDLFTITVPEAIEIIEAKRKAEREKVIKTFEDPNYQILNGRWGPYLVANGNNIKIPKGKDPLALSLADCIELEQQAPPSKKNFKKEVTSKQKSKVSAKSTAKQATKPKTQTKSNSEDSAKQPQKSRTSKVKKSGV